MLRMLLIYLHSGCANDLGVRLLDGKGKRGSGELRTTSGEGAARLKPAAEDGEGLQGWAEMALQVLMGEGQIGARKKGNTERKGGRGPIAGCVMVCLIDGPLKGG